MRDGTFLRFLKAVVRRATAAEVGLRRAASRLLGDRPRFRLEGSCEGCGACCETPMIAAPLPFVFVPTLRRLFLAWHARVNGFELQELRRAEGVFVFRCTHYDRDTRLCDSYESRPFMCRDYPRPLLAQPLPKLLPDCTYRLVDRRGAALRTALERRDLSPETLASLKRKLHLEE